MQRPGHHLAEFNTGILRHDWDDPRIAPFADALDRVNAIAQRSPGFVWRLSDDEMDAAQKDPKGVLGGNPRLASTLSVWEDGDSLRRFVHDTLHGRFMARASEWLLPEEAAMVLWWVPVGHRPTIEEAAARLDQFRSCGESEDAFGWKSLAKV